MSLVYFLTTVIILCCPQSFEVACAEFEDLNGGCPDVNASQPRPSYLLPLNPSKDPWSWYQRTLTFQVRPCLSQEPPSMSVSLSAAHKGASQHDVLTAD